MGIYYYFLIFLIGLSVGSFFNVIVFRFGKSQSALKGRSACFRCKSVINWFDLIPLFSYLFLRGRCRKCKYKISPVYPIMEAATALAIVLLFANATEIFGPVIMLRAFLVCLFVLIIFFDMRYLIIPDWILFLLAIAAIWLKLIDNNTDFVSLLIASLGMGSFFVILFAYSRGQWIGLGDIKLILFIGFLLGYPAGFISIMLSIWSAAIFSIVLLIARKATAKTRIPFGSFLSAMAVFSIIFEHEVQKIYQLFL